MGRLGQGDHSKTSLLLALFCWTTPEWLKVEGWMGWWLVGGPCDYCVSPSPKNLGFCVFQTWSGL